MKHHIRAATFTLLALLVIVAYCLILWWVASVFGGNTANEVAFCVIVIVAIYLWAWLLTDRMD